MQFSAGQDVRLKNYRARRPYLRAVSQPYLARNSTTLPSRGISASSRFSWRKVWNGVKCDFSSPHHHVRKIVGKLSVRRVQMWNFTRIGPKTKELWLLIGPAQGRLSIPAWDHPKKVWTATFLGRNSTSRTALKAFHLGHLDMEFQRDWPKDKKITALLIFWLKT